MNKIIAKFKKFDWVLLISTFLLICFGLVAIYSVTLSRESPDWLPLIKQIIALVIGLALFFLFTFLDYHLLRSYARWLYWLAVFLLILVLFFGEVMRGTRGWFSLAGFHFQPIELAKIVIIIYLAYYFSRQPRPLNRMKYFIFSGLVVLLPFILTFWQPDFGSAFILFFIWLGFVLVIGLKKHQWLIFIISGILIFSLSWCFILAPYQKDRLITFLNPAADPLDAGYNITQSIIAVGSGGLIGRGLSFGSQSQLKFLPEAQTDFVFAVIAEELGLLGVILVLGLFTFIFYRLYLITKKCRDDFPLFLVIGIMTFLFFQTVLNIGMNLGIAPITGITLPLLSYGGSSLIFTLMALGIIESIKLRN